MSSSLSPEKLRQLYINSVDVFVNAKKKLMSFEKLTAKKLKDSSKFMKIDKAIEDLDARQKAAHNKVEIVLRDYNQTKGLMILCEIQKLQKATVSLVDVLKSIKMRKQEPVPKLEATPMISRRASMSPLAAVSPRILNVSDHTRRSLSPTSTRSAKSVVSKPLTPVKDLLTANLDDLFVPYIEDPEDSSAESSRSAPELTAELSEEETIQEAEDYVFKADGSNDLFNMKHRWNKLNAPTNDIFLAIRHESMYNYCKERDDKLTEIAYQQCLEFVERHCPDRLAAMDSNSMEDK